MSTGPGNDPFSGSNTQNIILHLVSPKIINDGSGGYTVKTDLINVDNVYATGLVRAGIDGSGDVQSSTAFSIYDATTFATYGRITANSGNTWVQGISNIRFGQLNQFTTNTILALGAPGSNTDVLTVGGAVNVLGNFTGKSTGTVTATNGTPVSVSNTNVTANSIILLTVKTATGANAGQAYVSSTTPSTGFSITSGAADTSVYNYMILN